MSSKTEQILEALKALLTTVPGTNVERNTVVPESILTGGLIVLRDGDPGDPDVALGGIGSVYYSHDVDVELYVEDGDAITRDTAFDILVQAVGTALATDSSLNGLVFGVSSAEASALAAALASVGVKSEVAGTSVGRVMHMMDGAVRSGGKHLDILSKITGQTGETIKTLFQKNSMAAFVLFIEGLKRISDAGGSAAGAMAALGLADQRLLKTLPVLASRADLLATALDLANRETENAMALNEEAAKAFKSLNSQTELMWNNIKSLARSIGEDLAPGVTTAVKELGSLANQASIAYEQLKLLAQGDFNFDGLSLGSTRSIVGERKAELQDIARELKQLGDVGFMDDPLGWGRNGCRTTSHPSQKQGRARNRKIEAEIADLNQLLAEGAIAQETFSKASENVHDRMLRASQDWSAGVIRALRDYADEAGNAAKQFEQATSRSLQAGKDAFVEWAKTGKFNAKDLFNTIAEEALRAAVRMSVIKPFSGLLGDVFGSIGMDTLGVRSVGPLIFENAPKFHGGGVVDGEVEDQLARNIGRGEGLAPPWNIATGLIRRRGVIEFGPLPDL